MSDIERPELTVPNFCESCPIAPACDVGKIVIASLGTRVGVLIGLERGGLAIDQRPVPTTRFVVAYDIDNPDPDPAYLGQAPFPFNDYDAEAIVNEVATKVEFCEGPEEIGLLWFKQKVCGAGISRLSGRPRGGLYPGIVDIEPTAEELRYPGWFNVVAPRELKTKLCTEWFEAEQDGQTPEIQNSRLYGSFPAMAPSGRAFWDNEEAKEYFLARRKWPRATPIPKLSDEEQRQRLEETNRIFREESDDDAVFDDFMRGRPSLASLARQAGSIARKVISTDK